MSDPDPGAPNGVLLTVAYDGAGFVGWARQRVGRSVQDTLHGALLEVDPSASLPRGTSRTDSGVHADAHPVAFDARLPLGARGWVLALNARLPRDVAVRSARVICAGYNPRFASRWKRYRYRILLDPVRDPHACGRTWRVGWALDLDRTRREAECLVGTHDFAAFRAAQDGRSDTRRALARVEIEPEGHRVVAVVVEGDAFLHNMVRIIVGTLVDVGRGRLPEGTVTRAFESRERRDLGPTAPPEGLTLEHVELELPEGAGASWPP